MFRFNLILITLSISARIAFGGALDVWHPRQIPFPVSPPLSLMTHGNGTFVGLGESGTLLTSSNGIVWDWHLLTFGFQGSESSLSFADGRFFTTMPLATSSDGIRWTVAPPVAPSPRKLAHGNGVFVGISSDGDDSLIVSSNGTTWLRIGTHPEFDVNGIAFGQGLFLAVGTIYVDGFGQFGVVLTSSDGWRWTYRWMTDDAYPLHPFSSKQGFLVFGQFGSSLEGVRTNLLTSTDGISWTVQKFPNGFEFDEERAPLIIWGDRFVAAGRNLDGDTLLASSLNGETWDLHALPETPKLIEFRALASDNVTVVIAATDESGRGLLLQSDSAGGQPPDPVAPAALQLQIYPGLSITGTVGGTYTIESTSDLTVPAHWEVETNLTLSTNPQLWIDLRGDGQRRFYRAISR